MVENSNSKIAGACCGKQYCSTVLSEEMDLSFYSTVKTVSKGICACEVWDCLAAKVDGIAPLTFRRLMSTIVDVPHR